VLEERGEMHPNHLAIAYRDARFTWRDVDRRVNQYARFFQREGVGPKDVVAILMDNRPEYLFALLALNRLGAIASLINTHLTGSALTHALAVCAPKAILVGAEHEEALSEVLASLAGSPRVWTQAEEPCPEAPFRFERIDARVAQQSDARPSGLKRPNSSDVMCYIYTSGTTGLPKGAIITNHRYLAAGYAFGRAVLEITPRDILYVALPLYHSSATIVSFGSALTSGAAIALRRKFSTSQFWEDVRTYDATLFIYIGELCRYLLNAPPSPVERSHRLRMMAGNGLRPDIWEAFQRRFGIPLIREFYAATEGNAPIVNFEGRTGMLGRLKPGQVLVRCDPSTGEIRRNRAGFCERVAVGETGILLGHINPLLRFEGYLDKRESEGKVVCDVFRRGDRYFNSGDLLVLHEDGWVSFADRVGDTFRWKGENVSTNEVAEVLNGAQGVLESNVYGVAVPGADGRAGMASLRVEGQFDLDAFAAYVSAHLPSYQRPYFLRVQHDMRVTGTFKHQKTAYREEGFDPRRVSDPLYFFDGERYVPLDLPLFSRIQRGELVLR
jgi:fatty-acyl-CoA synthase